MSPSEYRAEAVGRFGFRATVVPNSIDLRLYHFRVRDHPRPTLFWLRRFHEIYHPELALLTLAQVRRTHPEAVLTMAGPDEGRLRHCRELTDRLGLSASVRFAGLLSKQEIAREADGHDIFLNTTRMDNAPVSVLEAMAAGLCVVSTDVDGIPYLLKEGVEALLVPPDDPERMAAAVRRCLDEPDVAARLSAGARRKAETFDVARVVPRWLELLGAPG